MFKPRRNDILRPGGDALMPIHVIAWNNCDENGAPIFEIDEPMTHEEYLKRVAGQFTWQSISLTKPISREAIDRAYLTGFGKEPTTEPT